MGRQADKDQWKSWTADQGGMETGRPGPGDPRPLVQTEQPWLFHPHTAASQLGLQGLDTCRAESQAEPLSSPPAGNLECIGIFGSSLRISPGGRGSRVVLGWGPQTHLPASPTLTQCPSLPDSQARPPASTSQLRTPQLFSLPPPPPGLASASHPQRLSVAVQTAA